MLAAAATATARVRLGTMVTPVARRRPWVLARQVTTVDHLSGGRAVLGVGLGVPPDVEYASFGESADPRAHAALLDEGLAVIAALWEGGPVTHDGPAHHLAGVRFAPRPVQRPRVPVWSACSLPARAGVRRAARWDGIVPIYATATEFRPAHPEEVAGIVAEIGAGRDLAGFDVVVWAVAPDPALARRVPRGRGDVADRGPGTGRRLARRRHGDRHRGSTGVSGAAVGVGSRRQGRSRRWRARRPHRHPDVTWHRRRTACSASTAAVDAANSRLGYVVSEAALRPPA